VSDNGATRTKRAAGAIAGTASARKVVEIPEKPTKTAQNTKKTVEIPDFPLTTGHIKPHREHR
jgi:hypothetical protein